MNASATNQTTLRVSYAAFFVVLAGFLYFCSRIGPNKGEISFVPITVLFAAAFGWQVFTTLRHRQSLLSWVLTLLYAVAIAVFIFEMLRFPGARRLW
jgi:hypothetical protein